MARLNMMKSVFAAAGVFGGVALVVLPAAFAQTNTPMTPTEMQQGMSNDQGGMMPGMMGSGEMQQKMARMMDNCNRMMESMMQNKDGTPTPPASQNKG